MSHWQRKILAVVALMLPAVSATAAAAHPMVENAMDVVIAPDGIVIDARISPEEILLVENGGGQGNDWPAMLTKHRDYLATHIHIQADQQAVTASTVSVASLPPRSDSTGRVPPALLAYRLRYVLRGEQTKVSRKK